MSHGDEILNVSPEPQDVLDTPPLEAAAPVGEAYWDIVWRQFCKKREALSALYAMAPLFLVAIFAPAIASNRPFVYFENGKVLFPWFRSLFHSQEPVDYFFNMALLAFFPWLLLALATNIVMRRRGAPGRRRLLVAAGQFVALTLGLCLAFWILSWKEIDLAPTNKYFSRTFVAEQFRSGGKDYGYYPPIRFGPSEIDTKSIYKPPGYRKTEGIKDINDNHTRWLGTDDSGRDILTRLLYGTRISMSVGFVAVGIYMAIGIFVGAIAGFFGGVTDMLISRVIEVVMLFPSFFLILTLVALLGPSIWIIMFVIGITGWTGVARLIRGEVLKQRGLEYVEAARSLGVSKWRIIFLHILPNSLAPAMVAAPFGVASAIVTEAGLSLLGFGVQPPTPSWGGVLNLASNNYNYAWLILCPAIAMFFTLTIFNLVGSGLRDAMDPRLRI